MSDATKILEIQTPTRGRKSTKKKKEKKELKTKIAVGLYKKKVEKDISRSKFKPSKRV